VLKGSRAIVSLISYQALVCHERKFFWLFNRLNAQINIKLWPIQTVWLRPFDVQNSSYHRFLEPRELLKRQEQLFIVEQEPKTVLRNVGYFNC